MSLVQNWYHLESVVPMFEYWILTHGVNRYMRNYATKIRRGLPFECFRRIIKSITKSIPYESCKLLMLCVLLCNTDFLTSSKFLPSLRWRHMSVMAPQITSHPTVCSIAFPESEYYAESVGTLWNHSGHMGSHGPLIRYVKLRVAHAPVVPGMFSPPPTSKETAS